MKTWKLTKVIHSDSVVLPENAYLYTMLFDSLCIYV